jgi:hypothetical protein
MVVMTLIVCFAALVAVAPYGLAYRGKRSMSVIISSSSEVMSDLSAGGATIRSFIDRVSARIGDVYEYAADAFSIRARTRE